MPQLTASSALRGDGVLPSAAAAVLASATPVLMPRNGPPVPTSLKPLATTGLSKEGWQRLAAHACDKHACEMHFFDVTPASRALLLSQAGLSAARALNVTPSRDDVTVASALFRVLLRPYGSAAAGAAQV